MFWFELIASSIVLPSTQTWRVLAQFMHSLLSGCSNSPRPFNGGSLPPVILDNSCHSQSGPQLAPIEVDRPPYHRDQLSLYSSTRGPSRGLASHSNVLLHQPVPQPPAEARNGLTHSQSHPHDQHFTSSRPIRAPSTSASPSPRNISP